MEKKALGKGLQALLPEKKTPAWKVEQDGKARCSAFVHLPQAEFDLTMLLLGQTRRVVQNRSLRKADR